jgi:hypothetical protein
MAVCGGGGEVLQLVVVMIWCFGWLFDELNKDGHGEGGFKVAAWI